MRDIGAHESRLYSDLAPLYDKTFGKFFYLRQRTVLGSLKLPYGANILEVGVGTGTSFPAYPRHCQVTGIDLAPHMLARAQAKIHKNSWTHVRVMRMDALDLQFPNDMFDYVMAFHVVTVVPDPVKMMQEVKRVCRPGGKIVIVNHFTSESRFWGRITRSLDPMTRYLGWRTNLRLKPFVKAMDLELEKTYKLSRFSLYTVLLGTNVKNGAAPPVDKNPLSDGNNAFPQIARP